MIQTLQGLLYLKELRKIRPDEILRRSVTVPFEEGKKKLIIFDLDETLIHCVGTQEECKGQRV